MSTENRMTGGATASTRLVHALAKTHSCRSAVCLLSAQCEIDTELLQHNVSSQPQCETGQAHFQMSWEV